jgi:MFS family permease
MVLSGAMLQLMMVTQNVLGFTPLVAGVVSFGTSLMLVLFSPISPRVMAKIGLGPTTLTGLLVTAAGLFGLATITDTTQPLVIMAWSAVMGTGLGFSMPAVSAGAMGAVPRESVGAISGVFALIGSISAVLGIAVLGAISATQVTNAWDATSSQVQDANELTSQVISGAIPQIEKSNGEQTAKIAGDAYLTGVTTALRIAAIGMVIAGALSYPLLGMRGRVRKGEDAAIPTEPPNTVSP